MRRCSAFLDALDPKVGPKLAHVTLIALNGELCIEAVALQGVYREALAAKVREPGEILVHARSAARVLAAVARELLPEPARIVLREAADGLALEMALILPTPEGAGHSEPITDIPHGSLSSSKVWVVASCAPQPMHDDWESAVRFQLDCGALRESLSLLAPVRAASAGSTVAGKPKVFFEIHAEDELIFSSCSGPALVVQRTPAALSGLQRQLKAQGMEMPVTLGYSMQVWNSLSSIRTLLPTEGSVQAALTFGVANTPRTLQLSGGHWEIELSGLERRELICPRESRERNSNPLLRRCYLPLLSDGGGSFSQLLQSCLAFKPRGIAIGIGSHEGAAVLTVRGSSMDGMFDLRWPIEADSLYDELAAETEIVLPPRNLRSALDAMPVDATGAVRLDLLGGTSGWMRHEAAAVVFSVGGADDTTRTAITLAGKHR